MVKVIRFSILSIAIFLRIYVLLTVPIPSLLCHRGQFVIPKAFLDSNLIQKVGDMPNILVWKSYCLPFLLSFSFLMSIDDRINPSRVCGESTIERWPCCPCWVSEDPAKVLLLNSSCKACG